ncbi:MAG: glycosyltransferase [Candidatus Bathyarchaeia archaeon]
MVIYLLRHCIFTVTVLKRSKCDVNLSKSDYTPTVTILIPARNEDKVIGRLLRRITEFTYPKDKLQVIVIDDGSTDQTERIVREYSKLYSYIIVLKREGKEAGKGKPSALNAALKHAIGEVVICFDADYYPQRDIVERLVRWFKDPTIGAVQGRVVVLNEPYNIVTRLIALERIGGYVVDQEARERLGLITQFGGTVGGIKRSLLESLGGWDETILAEDTEITFRIYLAGYRVKYDISAESYEEAVYGWRAYWKQRYRWARGHMECAFKYFLKVLKSDKLTPAQRIDGLLLLNIYFMPVLVLFSWLIGILLCLLRWGQWVTNLWLIPILFSYSSVGNFAPFYEVGVGAYIDGRSRACWLIPLLVIVFFYNILICSKAFLDVIVSKLIGKSKYVWEKTEHNGYINSM